MKKKQTFKLEQFEVLTELNTGNLLGGFSTVVGLSINLREPAPIDFPPTTNYNCSGGNCVAGCGSGSNRFICF